MGRVIAALCGVICILLSGCSTIVKGTEQQVSVATPGVQGAMCTLTSPAVGTRTVQTPGNIIIIVFQAFLYSAPLSTWITYFIVLIEQTIILTLMIIYHFYGTYNEINAFSNRDHVIDDFGDLDGNSEDIIV